MGYYVTSGNCEFTIKSENLPHAYELLCELNAHDELKTGRRIGSGWFRGCECTDITEKPADSKSVAENPNVWFSWMPWNYDERCKSATEILELVGFTVTQDEQGSIVFLSYDAKTGCEQEFLSALAPLVKDGSFIEWQGEETGDFYRYLYKSGKMHVQQPFIIWPEVE